MSAGNRYTIRVSPWVRPLLLLFTATGSRSWIELGTGGLEARFGWYSTTIPYESVKAGSRKHWPWYAGLGWRTNFKSVLALVGSYDGVVEISLDPAHRTRLMGIGINVEQFFVSLERPEEFLRDLEHRVVASPSH